jgi:hypothetical protein
MGMDKGTLRTMNSPIGNNLQALFDDVREVAYKRGHLQARLDLLKAIDKLNLEQRTAAWAISELMKHLEGIETPPAPKVETRGRKKKTSE